MRHAGLGSELAAASPRPAAYRSGRGLVWWLLSLGTAATGLAVGWWWMVFRVVIGNASLQLQAAMPCLVANSDLCSLAQALCGGQHWLGIRHYDTALFWAGVVLITAAMLSFVARRRAPAVPHPDRWMY